MTINWYRRRILIGIYVTKAIRPFWTWSVTQQPPTSKQSISTLSDWELNKCNTRNSWSNNILSLWFNVKDAECLSMRSTIYERVCRHVRMYCMQTHGRLCGRFPTGRENARAIAHDSMTFNGFSFRISDGPSCYHNYGAFKQLPQSDYSARGLVINGCVTLHARRMVGFCCVISKQRPFQKKWEKKNDDSRTLPS